MEIPLEPLSAGFSTTLTSLQGLIDKFSNFSAVLFAMTTRCCLPHCYCCRHLNFLVESVQRCILSFLTPSLSSICFLRQIQLIVTWSYLDWIALCLMGTAQHFTISELSVNVVSSFRFLHDTLSSACCVFEYMKPKTLCIWFRSSFSLTTLFILSSKRTTAPMTSQCDA